MSNFYVLADYHKNGGNLPTDLKAQNDFINQRIASNSSLYKESFFLESWLKAYNSENEKVVFLRFFDGVSLENEGCFGFLCLKITSHPLFSEYVNGGFLFGYPGPAILPGHELVFFRLLTEWLSREKHLWTCKIGPTRDPLHEIADLSESHILSKPLSHASAPFIKITEDYRPPSENHRNMLRKKSRLLATRNHEFILIDSSSDPRFPELFEDWVMMLKTRWPKGHFVVDEQRHRLFYSDLAKELSLRKEFLFSALIIDEHPAAIIFGIVQKDRFFDFTAAMSLDFAHFGPSQLLIKKLLEELPKRGVTIFDFMNDMEAYKLQWTLDAAPRFEYEICSHFFMQSRFRNRWNPKSLILRFTSPKNIVRFIRNPVATLRRF